MCLKFSQDFVELVLSVWWVDLQFLNFVACKFIAPKVGRLRKPLEKFSRKFQRFVKDKVNNLYCKSLEKVVHEGRITGCTTKYEDIGNQSVYALAHIFSNHQLNLPPTTYHSVVEVLLLVIVMAQRNLLLKREQSLHDEINDPQVDNRGKHLKISCLHSNLCRKFYFRSETRFRVTF